MATKNEYPFVRPYCRIMGSYEYFVHGEIERLRAMNAPRDAYACRHGGGYYSVSGLREPGKNADLADRLERAAGVTAAEVLA